VYLFKVLALKYPLVPSFGTWAILLPQELIVSLEFGALLTIST